MLEQNEPKILNINFRRNSFVYVKYLETLLSWIIKYFSCSLEKKVFNKYIHELLNLATKR